MPTSPDSPGRQRDRQRSGAGQVHPSLGRRSARSPGARRCGTSSWQIIDFAHRDGARRTRRKASATARAARDVDQRRRNATDPGHEVDCAGHALVAADPAFDLLTRQAMLANDRP